LQRAWTGSCSRVLCGAQAVVCSAAGELEGTNESDEDSGRETAPWRTKLAPGIQSSWEGANCPSMYQPTRFARLSRPDSPSNTLLNGSSHGRESRTPGSDGAGSFVSVLLLYRSVPRNPQGHSSSDKIRSSASAGVIVTVVAAFALVAAVSVGPWLFNARGSALERSPPTSLRTYEVQPTRSAELGRHESGSGGLRGVR